MPLVRDRRNIDSSVPDGGIMLAWTGQPDQRGGRSGAVFAARVREALRELGARAWSFRARTTHSSDGEAVVTPPPASQSPGSWSTPPLATPYPASSTGTSSKKSVASPSTNDEPSPRDETEPLSGNLS